jgi:Arc/MetJ-type ribon-helix-helix transcriptional regulator
MVKDWNGVYAGTKIPLILKNSIQEAISTGNYLNFSDFIRDAIKEKLQKEGFVRPGTRTEEDDHGVQP